MKDRSHDDAMAELFKEDPTFAAEYLNQLLQDGEPADLLIALRQIAQAHGGVRAIAKATELNANQLYRTLSPQGNPELRSLSAILKALGLRLAVQVAPQQPHVAST
jgi:probable addiction module antidote protein